MKKRIGGFFEIEAIDSNSEITGTTALDYWTKNKSFGLFSTARSIILELRKELESSRIWVPEIFCGVLQEANGVNTYLLAKNGFDPDVQFLNENLKENDIVIVVNYFGTEVSAEFIEFVNQKTSVYWIEDACHSLQPLANWADFTLFSPRKLFGVADGGIIVQNSAKSKAIVFANWTVEVSASPKSISPFLRLVSPDYPNLNNVYRTEELNLDNNLRAMSDFTQWQLKYLTVDKKIERRRENFSYLKEEFEELLPVGLNFSPETIPFGFPIYINSRDEIQKRLFRRGIFPPIHWLSNEKSKTHRRLQHEKLSLTIPCDHRYDSADMDYIKTNLKSLLMN